MSRAAWLLTHLTVRGAWSWPTAIVVYVLNLAVGTVSVYGASAQWWQRFVAVTAGTIAIFAVVGLGALVERRMAPAWQRGALALGTFAVAGAARGAAVSGVFLAWDVAGGGTEWLRVLGGVALGLAVLTPMALFIGEAREFAAARALLLVRQDQLASSVEQVATQINERDDVVLERIRVAFTRALSSPGNTASPSMVESTSPDDLDALALEVIRPLSHELAQVVPSVELPVGEITAGRISWRAIADASCQGKPFLSLSTTLLVTLLSVPSLGAIVGVTWTIAYVLIGVPLLLSLFVMANAVLVATLADRSLLVRIVMVLGAMGMVAVAAGFLAHVVYLLTSADTRAGEASSPYTVMAILVPLLSLPLVAARGTFIVLRQTLDQLGEVDVALSRRLARLRQVQWSHQRVLARALHGPVQTLVLAGAKRLREVDDDDRPAQAGALQAEFLHLLDGDTDRDDRVSWSEGVLRIEATWAGVAEVRICVSPEATERLDTDRVAADVMTEIIGEGVGNAVRHGDATQVEATVAIDGPDLRFSVVDDGCRGLRSGAGMGSRLLDDCCLWWERVEVAHGVRLQGVLPGGDPANEGHPSVPSGVREG